MSEAGHAVNMAEVFGPKRPVDGGTVFLRRAGLQPVDDGNGEVAPPVSFQRVEFFDMPERPAGGTVYATPEVAGIIPVAETIELDTPA